MSEFRFYNIAEVRCPNCGKALAFLRASIGQRLLMSHPVALCPLSGKKFFAAPFVVNLTEATDEVKP